MQAKTKTGDCIMWYIGTSLGKCLKSIIMGEVREEDVLVIITGTTASKFESYMNVIDIYYRKGNYHVTDPESYEVSGVSEQEYKELAITLWNKGKIHQPHTYPDHWGTFSMIRGETWLQVVPTLNNSTPAVVDAYEKYKMLDALTKDD